MTTEELQNLPTEALLKRQRLLNIAIGVLIGLCLVIVCVALVTDTKSTLSTLSGAGMMVPMIALASQLRKVKAELQEREKQG